MKKPVYLIPTIDVCQAENYHLMANTLNTEDERGPQGAHEMDDPWDENEFIKEKKFDDEDGFSWDDYHRQGILDE